MTVPQGVGSRFRVTVSHKKYGLPENDSRPCPHFTIQDSHVIRS
jgi:hypothetical protein